MPDLRPTFPRAAASGRSVRERVIPAWAAVNRTVAIWENYPILSGARSALAPLLEEPLLKVRGAFRAALLLTLVLLVGCSSAPTGRGGGETGAGQRSGAPKRITAAILGDLNTFSYLI